MSRIIEILVVLAVAIGSGYFYGHARYEAGRKSMVKDIEEARAASQEEKDRIDEEIDQLSDDELLDRARGWVRDDTGG